MKIGIMCGGSADRTGLDEMIARGKDLEARGFPTMWIPNVFGNDAITAASVVGSHTERIELGTAVVPTYPRHPAAIAQQALTASVACGGRFTLGIGLSHPPVIERLGLSYARRSSHMREYLEVLGPLLRREPAKFVGDEYHVEWALDVVDAEPVPVVIAALGEQMLKVTGRYADGTILWMAGFEAIERHIVPKLRAAASEAGRPEPRVIAGMHIMLTNDADAGRARVSRLVAMYGHMPSYRAMLDIEGVEDPAHFSLVGDEQALDAGLMRLRDIGVTDFEASLFADDEGAEERTLEYLQDRL